MENLIAAGLAVALAVYLGVAMLQPGKF